MGLPAMNIKFVARAQNSAKKAGPRICWNGAQRCKGSKWESGNNFFK